MLKPGDIVRTTSNSSWAPDVTVRILSQVGNDSWFVSVLEDGQETCKTILYEDELSTHDH